mmetsp:Transcript_158881/g.280694  ORF Transcript_158881/g.280694 Transcript_158881/m.280694 type:complete len:283 (-) Transcript_158881:182-1030(-)
MPSETNLALSLPRVHWGDENAAQHLLLVHGYLSCAATFVQLGERLAGLGWFVTAVDLRGHGDAPRASSYLLEDYAADIMNIKPSDGRPWDLVLAHSMGASFSVKAASKNPAWLLRLAMLDPYLIWAPADMADVIPVLEACQSETVEDVLEKNPHWDMAVVKAKVAGQSRADPLAIEQTVMKNGSRDLRSEAANLGVPLLIIGGDPQKGGISWGRSFSDASGADYVCLEGTGHNPHRDKPDAVLEALDCWANHQARVDHRQTGGLSIKHESSSLAAEFSNYGS